MPASQSPVDRDRFSDAVERAIADVLPSDDPLDCADFDPIAYLNTQFPDEVSLSRIDQFSVDLNDRIQNLDEEIFEAIREQAVASKQTSRDVDDAKQSILQLSHKIKDIKSKAEQSEVMVEEICRDIKQLDSAKHHLTTTIASLKKLQMWVTAIDQLQKMSKTGEYNRAAYLVSAVTSLASYFEAYTDVPKVAELCGVVKELQKDLKEKIFDQFRERLIRLFYEDQLRPYNRLFGRGGEGYILTEEAAVDRRFKWFKRLLKIFDKHLADVFPQNWQMCRRICIQFYLHVKLLMHHLRVTKSFERMLCDRFKEIEDSDDSTNRSGGGGPEFDDDGQLIDPNSAEGIQKEKRETNRFNDDNINNEIQLKKFKGIISAAFQPYLSKYVEAEKANMITIMEQAMSEEEENMTSGNIGVLQSAAEIKSVLATYSERLSEKLPKSQFNSSLGDHFVIKDDKTRDWICFIVNTAAYCAETSPQLEELLQDEIDEVFEEHVLNFVPNDFFEIFFQNTCVDVGDQSPYVVEISKILREQVIPIRSALSGPIYFNNFCDRFAALFLPRFTQNIFKCKRISEMAAQQLLLDTHAVKTSFLSVPTSDLESDEKATMIRSLSTFSKYANKEANKAVMLLKLIGTPLERLPQSFKILWVGGTAADLQRVMTLKGEKKSDQQEVIEKMGLEYKPTSLTGTVSDAAAELSQRFNTNTAAATAANFASMFRMGSSSSSSQN
eukprot:GSMAST32.ASY1.ANO1.893.1 assembled CDS